MATSSGDTTSGHRWEPRLVMPGARFTKGREGPTGARRARTTGGGARGGPIRRRWGTRGADPPPVGHAGGWSTGGGARGGREGPPFPPRPKISSIVSTSGYERVSHTEVGSCPQVRRRAGPCPRCVVPHGEPWKRSGGSTSGHERGSRSPVWSSPRKVRLGADGYPDASNLPANPGRGGKGGPLRPPRAPPPVDRPPACPTAGGSCSTCTRGSSSPFVNRAPATGVPGTAGSVYDVLAKGPRAQERPAGGGREPRGDGASSQRRPCADTIQRSAGAAPLTKCSPTSRQPAMPDQPAWRLRVRPHRRGWSPPPAYVVPPTTSTGQLSTARASVSARGRGTRASSRPSTAKS